MQLITHVSFNAFKVCIVEEKIIFFLNQLAEIFDFPKKMIRKYFNYKRDIMRKSNKNKFKLLL